MDSINPNLRPKSGGKPDSAEAIFKDMRRGSRSALSRAITLVESSLSSHQHLADELIKMALPFSGDSIRLGITGVPGVGKSTFIESFGKHLIAKGHKLAVLAIDPSSSKTKGSILGDKTRMQELSRDEHAFIRPTPSAGSLGGVANATRESIILCEAAGYDVIIIETVGVGQSETAVKSMVDFFMLLMLAGAGDELQGIKRGIMEMADLLLINKADGDNLKAARQAAGEYKRALHLFPPNDNEWIPKVMSISSLDQKGMAETWDCIESFSNQQRLKGYFQENRQGQMLGWFKTALQERIIGKFYSDANNLSRIRELELKIENGDISPSAAVKELLK